MNRLITCQGPCFMSSANFTNMPHYKNICMLPVLHHLKTHAANADPSFNLNSNRRHKYILIFVLPFVVILAQAPFIVGWGQTITVNRVVPRSICASSTESQPALVTSTTAGFPGQNVLYIAQLSDANGSFDNPIAIGARTPVSPNHNNLLIPARIPANLPAGNYQIRVISDNPPHISGNSVPFVIGTGVSPTLTLTKHDVSGCGGGDDGIITGMAFGGSAPYTYYLYTPAEISNTTGVFLGLDAGRYGMQVSDANGCSSELDTVQLIAIPSPTIEVSTKGNTSSCRDIDDGFFTIRVFPRDGIIATAKKPYTWELAPDVPGSFNPAPSAPFKFSNLPQDTYSVTMTDSFGCASNTITGIEIKKDTLPEVTVGSFQVPGCGASNGQMVVFARYGSHSTYRYSYSFNGGTFSIPQSGHRFTGLASGPYIIRATDSRGCEDTLNFTLPAPLNCFTGAAVSINNLNGAAINALSVQVLPNPSKSTFTLNLQSSSKEVVHVIVMDMVGKKVYQTTGTNNRYVFGADFASGTYIVQIIQGKELQMFKLIKVN